MNYTEMNAQVFDEWNKAGWEWGIPIDHETWKRAQKGDWSVLLTPTKAVPAAWFPDLRGKKILGLASGGGQQMPIFTAAGAHCTLLDYADSQLEMEVLVAEREGYEIEIVKGDMTKPLPFPDASFDLIFHPVSNCYVEEVLPIWKECYRVLKEGGILMSGLDNGFNFLFDDEDKIRFPLPFYPLKDERLLEYCLQRDWGIQFSHSIEEQIGGQLEAGFQLTHIYSDTNGEGLLHQYRVPTYYATRSVKWTK